MCFLRDIGLQVEVVPGAAGFVEHIAIVDGGLRVDPNARASGILHEAGHLAVVPARFRHYLRGNINNGIRRMLDEIDTLDLEPDSPLMRAAFQTGDPEATGWAWAAGKAIGLVDHMIIQDDEYDAEGAFMRLCLSSNSYLGINGLSHAGFCVPRHHPYRDLPTYPSLAFWLQR